MWLIIGYGNRVRGDDAAGPLLAEQLRTLIPDGRARVLSIHQLTPELVEELIRPEIDQVLFIDVTRKQQEAERFAQLEPAVATGQCFGHQQYPELLLFTAQYLYQKTIPGWLLTLPGYCFDFSEQLSPATAAAINKGLNTVIDFINQKG